MSNTLNTLRLLDLLNIDKVNFISEVQTRLLSPDSEEFKAQLLKLLILHPSHFTYLISERKRIYHLDPHHDDF